jgi:glycerol-3-phosphate dehydrogenase (NAD(P)+)
MNKPIAVLGAGAWGTALSFLFADNQQNIHLWNNNKAYIQELQKTRKLKDHLPEKKLPHQIYLFENLSEALLNVEDIFIVVPSHAFTEVIEKISPLISKKFRIAWATKGLDSSAEFFHEIVEAKLGHCPMAVLSGPSFAKEVLLKKPTQVVLASNNQEFSKDLFKGLQSAYFKLELSQDMIGVQLCGALKNILAIAVGISDGLNLGANARCALITNSLKEMASLGKALGAHTETFFGLAGLGDVILTSMDNQSRNRRFGYALGEGNNVETAEKMIAATIEGKENTLNVFQLMQKHQVNCRFAKGMYEVLYQNRLAAEVIADLL